MRAPARIHIREVSPRDGLQVEPRFVDTAAKSTLVDLLVRTGFERINVTSFVSPKKIPQMADAEALVASLPRDSRTKFDATVPNERGAQRAVDAGVDAISVFVSASDIGSHANVGRSTEESLHRATAAVRLAADAGLATYGTVSKAFGSPFGDTVDKEHVLELAGRFVDAGVDGVAFGDTSGEANPSQVHDLVTEFFARHPDTELALHFHDTRGLALANVVAAMDAGATHFDAAVGGIGGSPFTKNSAGNVATEDLVNMCESMGIDTGTDMNELLAARDFVAALLDRELPGKLGNLPREEIGVIS